MDFIPLSIWAVGILAVFAYKDRTYIQSGMGIDETHKKTSPPQAKLFIAGGLFFLILGMISTSWR